MKEYAVSYQTPGCDPDELEERLREDQNVTFLAEESGGFFVESDPQTMLEIAEETGCEYREADDI